MRALKYDCLCPIVENMSYQELMDDVVLAGMNCCDSRNNPGRGWICSNLDKELRRADKERQRQEAYDRKKNG